MEPLATPPTPDVSATEGCESDVGNTDPARRQFPTTVSHPAVSRCLRHLAGLEGEIREHLDNVDTAAPGGSGVDLRALIEAVETDIRRLERMEEKENVMDQFELESLPGYRPKKSDRLGVDPRRGDVYIHFSPSSRPILESPPPPPLPPKKRKRGQKRSDRMEGRFQQRILSERPLKEEENPRIFLLEKPRQNKLGEGSNSHNKLEGRNSASRLLFCPLCAQTFAHGFALECHLTSVHRGDLDGDSGGGDVLQCTCCRAQFLTGAAALRHLRCHHPEAAVAMAADRVASDGQIYPTEPKADRDASCRFCPQRFLRRHSKLLLLHLERSHAERLGEMMSTAPDGNERTQEVNMALDMILDKRSVNVSSPSDLPLVEKSHFYYEINDSPLNCRNDDGRPASAMSTTSRRNQTDLFRRRHGSAESPRRSPSKSHPGFSLTSPSARQTKLFRCNLCPASFLENAFLLSHIKSCHQLRPAGVLTGVLLRPHYACGACPARFFKNSFLVRHVESRHQFQLVRN